ncbi:hypothetical protein CAPTEDRAFT_152062 [Capitella teleta]|uniref:Glutaredoxin-2, mitochondrial n=1 Tax=Capitella teleta TaxID=283909 RepID=R7T6A2_CAPTE|nr:hypothetical protein CAPTEDRAFT_152062 [Capitella teleta]|eukprot:ELT88803.1 hypothetical protein CAPTEDRAFT_152062 [Capitella teleta]
MAPVPNVEELNKFIKDSVHANQVMIWSKSYCPYCKKVKDIFQSLNQEFKAYELDLEDNGPAIQDALHKMTGQKTVPNVFVNGTRLGGCDDTERAFRDRRLQQMLNPAPSSSVDHHDLESYDYDLVVIGGGSGGLAAAKEAAALGAKVACLDFVKPSTQGTTWGLGGTCVNVGCIPKKLMHQAAILGHQLDDSRKFGWEFDDKVSFNWETLRTNIQDHIGSLNWNYRVQLRSQNVDYVNSYAQFIGPHRIKATNKKGKEQEMTAKFFLIATGGRPKMPDNIEGLRQFCISSDDLFSLPYSPGKTLVVGASYVALECAGFLAALNYDVTISVRSILLRGFDQQMAENIGAYMANHGVKFIRPCVPYKVERLEEGTPGKYRVYSKMQDSGEEVVGEYNTVLIAVGRDPCTRDLGLDTVGVQINKQGFIVAADDAEQTSCPYIHAVGDILDGKPELTPMAIQAGRLLAGRLFAGTNNKTDYTNVPTTVFTPIEYGCIGLAEEDAIAKYGQSDLEVYHSNYLPLEWTVPHKEENACYAKLICLKSQNLKVVGFHVMGPNAGEITQGFTLALKLGAKKADFDNAIGIHPTCAEIFTTLQVTKSSGQDASASGC